MDLQTITRAVAQSLARRDERRDILAGRIRDLSIQAMTAARATHLDIGEAGTLEYRTPIGDCSQWANRMDYPEHAGEPALMLIAGGEVRSLGPTPTCGFWDGHNHQYQQGPTRDSLTSEVIHPATVAQLRALARELPTVVAEQLLATQSVAEEETIVADATLETLWDGEHSREMERIVERGKVRE